MKVLVTGGAGFIGFHTSQALLARGDNVIIVDSLNEYYDPSLKRARLKILEQNANCTFIHADVSDEEVMEKVFKKHSFDKVCHLAAQAGVRYSLDHPLVYENANGKGTLVLLEMCKKHSVNHFVYASSSSVYGGSKELPFKENNPVMEPISLYAATKRYNELQAHVYHKLYGIQCTGLRFFTVYGPYGRPDMALFLFTKAILEGKPIDVYNNGDMKRDFTYITDIVSGVIASLDNPYPYEIINLARGEQIKLMDFISEIETYLGKKAQKNMMPLQMGDVPETSGDIEKAQKLLGYKPQTSVKEGVQNFIKWYKEYYNTE
ncbi:MAG: SDR family NAD(P)-dependent oxidoreductase [Candidatus Woesearchaeota archaeon]